MKNRIPGVLFLIVGIIALVIVSQNPRFQSVDRKDVVALVGCGMWFGMGIITLLVGLEPLRKVARK